MKESSTYQAILEEGRGEGAVAEAKKCCDFWAMTLSVPLMPEPPLPLSGSTI